MQQQAGASRWIVPTGGNTGAKRTKGTLLSESPVKPDVREPRVALTDTQTVLVRVALRSDDGGQLFDGQLLDISRGGVKLAVPHSLPFAEKVDLQIAVPDLQLDFSAAAVVSWSRQEVDGRWLVGCHFDPALPEATVNRLAHAGYLERRQSPRYPVSLEATASFELSGHGFSVWIQDFSTDGFSMLSPRPGEIDQRLRLEVTKGDGKPVVISARTRWCVSVDDGYLVGCALINAHDFQHFWELTYQTSPNQPVLPRVTLPSSPWTMAWFAALMLFVVVYPIVIWLIAARPRAEMDRTAGRMVEEHAGPEATGAPASGSAKLARAPTGGDLPFSAEQLEARSKELARRGSELERKSDQLAKEAAELEAERARWTERQAAQRERLAALQQQIDADRDALRAQRQELEAARARWQQEQQQWTAAKRAWEAQQQTALRARRQWEQERQTLAAEKKAWREQQRAALAARTGDHRPHRGPLPIQTADAAPMRTGGPATENVAAAARSEVPQRRNSPPTVVDRTHRAPRQTRSVVSQATPSAQRRQAAAAYRRGRASLIGGQYTQAVTLLQRAIEFAPDEPIYHYLLALAQHQLDDDGSAAKHVTAGARLEQRRPIDGWGHRMERFQGAPRLWLERARAKAKRNAAAELATG